MPIPSQHGPRRSMAPIRSPGTHGGPVLMEHKTSIPKQGCPPPMHLAKALGWPFRLLPCLMRAPATKERVYRHLGLGNRVRSWKLAGPTTGC